MSQFWAVIGRMCVDATFHAALFNEADYFKTYNGLVGLRTFLARGEGLRLSRYDVIELNRIVRSKIENNTDIVVFDDVSDDTTVAGIRTGFSLTNMPTRDHLELYSFIGLSCIDGTFLSTAHAVSDQRPDEIARLRALLNAPSENVPFFVLTDAELRTVNTFLRSNGDQARVFMNEFRTTRWVQPAACSEGYSTKILNGVAVDYVHTAQAELLLAMRKNPALSEALRETPALQWPEGETPEIRLDKVRRLNALSEPV